MTQTTQKRPRKARVRDTHAHSLRGFPHGTRVVAGGWSLRGYKGKGGGGGRTPVEAADSLHSTSYARVLDLLGEGEIQGLINGLQSVYLDGTPLQNADGTMNFTGVSVDFRAGTQLQDYIPGFPAAGR